MGFNSAFKGLIASPVFRIHIYQTLIQWNVIWHVSVCMWEVSTHFLYDTLIYIIFNSFLPNTVFIHLRISVPWQQCVLKLSFSSGLLEFHTTRLLIHQTDDDVEWEIRTS